MANLNIGHIKGGTGQGVPTGGTSGQLLAKNSNTDYDMTWVNPPNGAFDPFPVEKIYATGQTPSGYYIDKNGNQTALTVSGGILYLPAGIFDDGELHQIVLDLYNPAATGYQMTLRYNGTVKVKVSKWYFQDGSSSDYFFIQNETTTWTPTTTIFGYTNTYARVSGYMWVQKTT